MAVQPLTNTDEDEVIFPPPGGQPDPFAGFSGLGTGLADDAASSFKNRLAGTSTGTVDTGTPPDDVGGFFGITGGIAGQGRDYKDTAKPIAEPATGLQADVTTKTSTITPPPAPIPLETKPQELTKDEVKKTSTITPKPPPATEVDKTVDLTLEGTRDDIDTAGMEFIRQMMEGDDPIAELAFNWQIQKIGPIFGAQNDNLILRLKQQGISGTNAGTAWLNNMARTQGVQLSDIVGKINYDSAVRIEEWNRNGPERANAILTNRLNYKIDKYDYGMKQIKDLQDLGEVDPQTYMNIAAANGVSMTPETAKFISEHITSEKAADISASLREVHSNYGEIEKSMEDMVPGLAIDGSAYSSLTPQQQSDLRARVKQINNAIKSNDVVGAQTMMQELKQLYPNAVVGDYAEWNPNDFRTHTDNVAIQTFKADAKLLLTQGDEIGAAKILIDKVIDPTTVDKVFADLWSTISPERKAELLEASGLDGEPITHDDKTQILAHDMLSGMETTTTEEIFKSYYNNAKGVEIEGVSLQEWLLDPENATLTRSWIFEVTSGPYEIDANGLIVPKAGQQLPPWNPDSNNSHYFTDWAMADSYSEADGLNLTYTGNNAYEDDNVFQTSDGYMNYKSQMDKAWEAYKKGDGDLTRQEWFDAVKPVWDGDSLAFNGVAGKRGEGEFDPLTSELEFVKASVTKFNEAVVSGDFSNMSNDEIFSALTNDAQAMTNLENSGKVETYTKGDFNGVLRLSDFTALGLVADQVWDHNVDDDVDTVDTGAGKGKGSIIIINNRPARIVMFTSGNYTSDSGLYRERDGAIYVEYLDEDPATREKVVVGGAPRQKV
jgi:hypothetical protein